MFRIRPRATPTWRRPGVKKKLCALLLVLSPGAARGESPRPHILSIIEDDLGFFDSGIHNPDAVAWSGNITALARDGITLMRHYTHWHCSPSRRTFLTGRLPIHHGEQLSGDDADDIDLRMTWISQKLRTAGYRTAMFGKWHTGFRSFAHLPYSRGFDVAVGSLQTGGAYEGSGHQTRWQGAHPIWNDSQWEPGTAPATCDAYAKVGCNAAAWMPETEMQCGALLHYTNASLAGACCADCARNASCTHWVYKPGSPHPCHVKAGANDCAQSQANATSGRVVPVEARRCTDE